MTIEEQLKKMIDEIDGTDPSLEDMLEITFKGMEYLETDEFKEKDEIGKMFFKNLLIDMINYLGRQGEKYKTKIMEKAMELVERRKK